MFYELKHSTSGEEFEVQYKHNFAFHVHMHRSFELFYITEGKIEATISDKLYVIHRGEAVLIFPHQKHSFKCITDSDAVLIIFSPELVSSFFEQYQEYRPENNKFLLASIPDKFYNIWDKKALLYSVLGNLCRSTELEKCQKESIDALIERLFSYIELHYKSKCTLTEAAEQLGYTPEYISRYFKKHIGITFHKYVNSRRVEHSCTLLSKHNRNYSIAEISYLSGFDSIKTYNRVFKQYMDISPTTYRKQIVK